MRLPQPILLSLLCLTACAELKEARQEQQEIEVAAETVENALQQLPSADALRMLAELQDARGPVEEVHRLSAHPDPAVRAAAVRAAAMIGRVDSADLLRARLLDRAPEVRIASAFGLSQLWAWPLTGLDRATTDAGAEEALDAALTEELQDGKNSVAAAMIRALGEVGTESSEDVLWAIAAAERMELREQATLALGVRGKRGALSFRAGDVERLGALLATPELRFAAAWSIARSPVDEEARAALEPLLVGALTAEDTDANAWLVRALGKTAGAGALEVWARELSPRQRLNAVRGAVAAKHEPTLVAAITADHASATEALRALAAHPTDTTWAALQAPLGDGLAGPRLDALAGFVGSSKERDAAILEDARAAIASGDPALRPGAAAILLELQGADCALLAGFDAEALTTQLALASAVAELGQPWTEARLLGWLAGPDATFGAIAAEALAEREGEHITARLLESFGAHPDAADWERRLAIVRALAQRSGVPPDFFAEALREPSPHVRLAAYEAFGRLAGRSGSGRPPLAQPRQTLPDASFGVGDVERAVVTTSRGDLTMLLYPHLAPGAVANFVRLAEAGTYDGVLFHRVVPDFVIQTGDPTNTGWGGPGWTLRDEFTPLEYRRGTVGMARSDKDTAGSQWFITHSPQPHLTGHYTAFGQLILGWDALDGIQVGDRVESVQIVRRGAPQ